MAELVDAIDSKSIGGNLMRVRLSPAAQAKRSDEEEDTFVSSVREAKPD